MTTAIARPATPGALEKPYTVRDLLRDKQDEIRAALPRHIPPAYFLRVVLTAIQRTPKLAQCTSLSLFGAVLQCAQLGLVPDGFLGQAYLIPYENRKRKPPVFEVQFQPGYRGLVTLARRSGEIASIGATVVHAKDTFRQVLGIAPSVDHVPFDHADEDPGPLTHVYAWFRLRDAGGDVIVLNRRQVHAIRDHSQAYRTGLRTGTKDSPWFTHEEWMWKKTALKQLLKLAPLSVEIQRAAALDDAHDAGVPQDLHLVADPTSDPTPMLEGEGGEDELGADEVEMPQRTPAAPPLTPTLPVLPTSAGGPMLDRILDTGAAGNAWTAITQGGLKLWTRDRALGEQLVAAKGALRQITTEAPDDKGRRQVIALEV